MLNFFRKKWLRYIAVRAFFVWGVVIISLYFHYYPGYGASFLWTVQVSLLLIGLLTMLAVILFMAYPMLKKAGFIENKIVYIRKIASKLNQKEINLPLLFFPVFFYICSFLWISYIFGRSHDLLIVTNAVYTVFILPVLVIIAFSLGYRLLKIFKFSFSGWLEKFLLSEAIGFGSLMLFMYFLGMAELYYRSVAYALVGLIAFFSYKEIIELWNYVKNNKVVWNIQPLLSFKNFLIVAIALIIGIYVAGIFQQYPTGWDSLHTYAAFPKAYVENHGIINFPYWLYFGFPQNSEMLFTLGYLLNGLTLVAGINVIFVILISGVLYLFSRIFLEKEYSYLPVFLFLALPMTSHLTILDIKVELIFSFYVLMGSFYLFQYLIKKSSGALIIFSVMSGIASGIKYNFFLLFLPSLLSVIFFTKRLCIKEKMKSAAIFLFFIGALFSPWAMKNIIYSGNPIDPIAGDRISRNDTFFKRNEISYAQSINGIMDDAKLFYENREVKNWKYYILFPFRITFNLRTESNLDGLNPGYFFLIFSPLLLVFLKKKEDFSTKRLLAMFVAMSFVFWYFFTNIFIIYIFPIFPLLSLVVAIAIKELRSRVVYIASAIFCIIFTVSFTTDQMYKRLVFAPLIKTEQTSNDNKILMAKYINNNIHDGIIWNFHYPIHYFVESPQGKIVFDPYLFMFHSFLNNHSLDQANEDFRKIGVRYFLFRGDYGESTSFMLTSAIESRKISPLAAQRFINNHDEFFQFRNKELVLVKNIDDFYLYKLKED